MPKVNFAHEGRTIEVPYGKNLRRAAIENGIDVYGFPAKFMNCGGHGLCGTCRVRVEPEWNLSDPTNAEIRKLKAAPLRLSCQARVEGDLTCYTVQKPVIEVRPVTLASCYMVISVERQEMVQVVEENMMQRNVFLDFAEADEIAREIALRYPDGDWQVREFADPLTTQEFSFSYNALRYPRPRPGDMLADGRGHLVAAGADEIKALPG